MRGREEHARGPGDDQDEVDDDRRPAESRLTLLASEGSGVA
jgi:hypothetical protein